MASLNSYQNFATITILLIIVVHLHHLLCPASCFDVPPQDLLFEEKNRLGSIPSTCHNKCNQGHPCMAVQVLNLPSHEHAHPGLASAATMESLFLQGNRYSNYKPLRWKCHCGDHFFNP